MRHALACVHIGLIVSAVSTQLPHAKLGEPAQFAPNKHTCRRLQQANHPRLLFVLRPGITDDEAIAVRALSLAGFHVGVHRVSGDLRSDSSHYAQFAGAPGEWVADLKHLRYRGMAFNASWHSTQEDSLLHSIGEWAPTLVLPDSTTSVRLMHSALLRGHSATSTGVHSGAFLSVQKSRMLIRCSLPHPRHYFTSTSKSSMTMLAKSLSVPTAPGFELTGTIDHLRDALPQKLIEHGLRLPVVLKTGSDGGGSGVQICGGGRSLLTCLSVLGSRRKRSQHKLLTTYYLLLTPCYLLLTTYYLLLKAQAYSQHTLLTTWYYLLRPTYYLLLAT